MSTTSDESSRSSRSFGSPASTRFALTRPRPGRTRPSRRSPPARRARPAARAARHRTTDSARRRSGFASGEVREIRENLLARYRLRIGRLDRLELHRCATLPEAFLSPGRSNRRRLRAAVVVRELLVEADVAHRAWPHLLE